MIQFGELGIELKSGIVFSALAFVLSIIAGFAGSVSAGMILVRSFILTPVFFAVGFGIVLVMKKFVPEVYEIFSNINKGTTSPVEKVEISTDTAEDVKYDSFEKPESGFSEFTEKDYDRLQTVKDSDRLQPVRDSDKIQAVNDSDRSKAENDSSLDSVLNTSGAKLGKHIIVENQLSSYEPKLIAQAIRTMMSKDKD